MSLKINPKEIVAVSQLSPEKRFTYFIKRIAGTEEMWGLYKERWALAADEEDISIFPVWPAAEYAQLCAILKWEGFAPRKIPLEEFIKRIIPELIKKHTFLGIFLNPENEGIVTSIPDFLDYLNDELVKY